MRLLRLTRLTLITGLLIASLGMNIATVAIGSIATLVGAAFETVTGTKAVTSQLKDQVTDRDRQIASLTDEVAELRGQRHVTYKGQRKLLSEAVEDTTTRISRRTTANAARNVTSVFGEAIPVIGIGVIVGVTGWELVDACETMKDLQALDLAFNPANAAPDDVSEVCGLEVPSKEDVWAAVRASPSKAWNGAKSWIPELPEWGADAGEPRDWWPFYNE